MLRLFTDPQTAYPAFILLLVFNLAILFQSFLFLKKHFRLKEKATKALSLEARQLGYNNSIVMVICAYLFLMVMFQGKYIYEAKIKTEDLTASLTQRDNIGHYSSKIFNGIRFGSKNGKFFRIDLKSTKSLKVLLFRGGQYTIDANDDNYQAAMRELYNDISAYNGFYNYQLFIRGSADSAKEHTFRNVYDDAVYRFDTCHYYKDISPGKNGDIFSATPTLLYFNNHITNVDLPALRSAYIATKLQIANESFKNIRLLEGKVEQVHNEQKRNVTILLFVDDESVMFQNPDVKGLGIFVLLFLFFFFIVIWCLINSSAILKRENARRAMLTKLKKFN